MLTQEIDLSWHARARVSVVQGATVIQRGDGNTQSDAVVNAPLLPGDYVSTGDGSRAEVQYDGDTAIRFGANVQARVTNDDPNNRSLQLADGPIEDEYRMVEQSLVEVQMPNLHGFFPDPPQSAPDKERGWLPYWNQVKPAAKPAAKAESNPASQSASNR